MGFFSEFYNLISQSGKFWSELTTSVYNQRMVLEKIVAMVGKQINEK